MEIMGFMDPSFWHLDGERAFEALVGIVILSFLLERALAVLFETRLFIDQAQGKSLKELIAFVFCAGVCWLLEFDAISIIFLKEKMTLFGMIITGAIVAGGSKASIRLFRDLMHFRSTAEKERLQNGKNNKTKGGGDEK